MPHLVDYVQQVLLQFVEHYRDVGVTEVARRDPLEASQGASLGENFAGMALSEWIAGRSTKNVICRPGPFLALPRDGR